MQWIAPSEKDIATDAVEKRLWDAADQLRANSGLTSAQYSTPVLGLIFLRFADVRFAKIRAGLEKMGLTPRPAARVCPRRPRARAAPVPAARAPARRAVP